MGKRRLCAIALLLLLLCVRAFADGDADPSAPGVTEVAEGEVFTASLGAGYRMNYYCFTPDETGLYAVELTANARLVIQIVNEDLVPTSVYQWFDSAGGRFVLEDLTAGIPVYFLISSYQEDLVFTAAVKKTGDFSYVVLGDGTASITDFAVKGDIVIPSVIDGYTVTSLKRELFYGKSGVTSVTIPATVTFFGEDRDDNEWDYVFSYCYHLKEILVEERNPVFRSVDGVLYSRDGTVLINYPCAKEGEVYRTDANVLCCTSFASCRELKALYLDDDDTVWRTYTFYDTDGLTVYYIPGGQSEMLAESFVARGLCEEGKFRPFATEAEPDLILPAGLTGIGAETFAGVKNVAIWVPASVTQIDPSAFDPSVIVVCPAGSYAERFCRENGITVVAH